MSRLLVGAAYVAVTVAALLTHQMTAAAYIGLIQLFCLYEFYSITLSSKSLKSRVFPLIVGSVLFFITYVYQDSVVNLGHIIWYLIPLLVLYFIYLVFTQSTDWIGDSAKTVMGWLYISLPLAFLLRMGNLVFDEANTDLLPYYGFQILLIFVLIWANDTFAYLVGRQIGKRPLASRLSPKKTIEGFVGGIVFSVGFSILMHRMFPFMERSHFIALALICSVVGTIGDLFESKIKRSLGIKDSGNTLGGHGGFLDRMDSILFASPACFFYLFHFTVM
ncbi:MAG: phosphatidate cytidylyltransferase [Bacteroidia bacterium]|nr:phosphatidate cytidylyltransferase [Bacteroidia bacterium]